MKLLLYCTKAKPYLLNQNIYEFYESKYITSTHKFHEKQDYLLNGKIVSECDFEVEEIACSKIDYDLSYAIDGTGQAFYNNSKEYKPFYLGLNISNIELLKRSCLTNKEMYDYLNSKNGYAIHIKNLHIFDEPRDLSDYTTRKPQTYDSIICDSCNNFGFDCKKCSSFYDYQQVMKAPQNMMKVCEWDVEDKILISIQPQWMCLILNGEKTIEVRKKVLREMIK